MLRLLFLLPAAAGALLAILIPVRFTRMSLVELRLLHGGDLSFEAEARRHAQQGRLQVARRYLLLAGKAESAAREDPLPQHLKTAADWYRYLSDAPALTALLRSGSGEHVISELSPPARALCQTLVAWQEGRKSALLFPVESDRGRATERLILLLGVIQDIGALRPALLEDVSRRMHQAGGGSWGELEKPLLGLLSLARRLTLDEIAVALGPARGLDEIADLAAWLQFHPEAQGESLAVLDHLGETGLPRLLRYLARYGPPGLADLVSALRLGEPALGMLLDRAATLHQPLGLRWLRNPDWDYLWIQAFRQRGLSQALRALLALLGGIFLACALEFMPSATNTGAWPRRMALGVFAALILLLALEDPRYLQEPRQPNLRVATPAQAAGAADTVTATGKGASMNQSQNQISLYFALGFFVLQVLAFFWGYLEIRRVARSEETPRVKLRLLDNDEHLFDLGLYLGLGGTVLSLTIIALGLFNPGMIAYTSTLFGIIEVAALKLVCLRPLRRDLIRLSASTL